MSSDRAPAERPAPDQTDSTDTIDATDQTGHGLGNITTVPGDRRTDSVSMLVVEAELAHDGTVLDNPAKPTTPDVFESLEERLEDTDLRPAYIVEAERKHTTEDGE